MKTSKYSAKKIKIKAPKAMAAKKMSPIHKSKPSAMADMLKKIL